MCLQVVKQLFHWAVFNPDTFRRNPFVLTADHACIRYVAGLQHALSILPRGSSTPESQVWHESTWLAPMVSHTIPAAKATDQISLLFGLTNCLLLSWL